MSEKTIQPYHRSQVPSELPLSAELQPRGASPLVSTCAVLAAALAMAATMPGRTHGLGLITTRLLEDFPSLGEFGFATLNFWATILGSVLCIPCGWLLDRFRINVVGGIVVFLLALTVLGMSVTHNVFMLAVMLTLTRCFGQSMLSVVSLAIIGKSFPRRPGVVMGIYAVVMTMFMAVWMGVLQDALPKIGWRETWWGMGIALAIIAPILCLLTPWRLKGKSWTAAGESESLSSTAREMKPESSASLQQALTSPCFWTFAIAISLFGLISSGFSLFQQSIFAAQGLDERIYHTVMLLGLAVGLIANLIGGALAVFVPLPRLLCGAMTLLAVGLGMVPYINTPNGAYLFCVVYGIGGGILTVLFFTVWGPAFGTRSLARIQGAAQMLTVLASAAGPLCVSGLRLAYGSDQSFLFVFAGASLLLGIVALFVPVPSAARGDWEDTMTSKEKLATLRESAS